ncbi:hypothetical protein [Nocardia sp. NPDC051463]|uniref:hypothetical protein n=1 Tax=Nocardia sp. NPDC051463 TaxID=3154845 RepID=UPI00344D0F9B
MIPEEVVAFVADLLRTPHDSPANEVGQLVWAALGSGSREDAIEAVRGVIHVNDRAEGPQSRAAELGYELWWLLGGRPVSPGVTARPVDQRGGFLARLRGAGLMA